MQDRKESDDLIVDERISNILSNDNEFKAWNEGLGIKLLIIFPLIVFVVGLVILNRPESLYQIFLTLLYPFVFILIGVLLLFLMGRYLW